jgi:2',3'-cyclic-nucleotide 2'-phosphodiesterase (5'-nucleotidase family)
MISRRSPWSVTVPLAVLVSGIAAAQPAPGVPSIPRSLDPPNNALVAPGPAPEIDLLYTGDVIGYLEDCGCHMNPAGGVSRRAWLLSQLQANYPSTPVVFLDSGNFSDNPTEAGDLRTATLLQSMKKLGYKAINVGERDLTYGYEDFIKRTEGIGLTFISTNIVKQGTKDPIFSPYTVIETKGTSGKKVRVGVLGVDRYSPVWQKAGPAGTNLGMAAPADMIATYLPEVRAKSDVVVLLAAISKEDARDLAKQFPKLDFIFGTYAGVFSTIEETEGPVRIVYTGNQGKRVGETRIVLDDKRAITDVDSYLHFLTIRYPEDKATQDALAPIIAKTKPKTPDAAQKPAVAGVKPAGGS